MADRPWVVEVNEGQVEITRQGTNWWTLYRLRMGPIGRIREIKAACIVGGIVEVACDSRADADWLASSMCVDHGLPRTAVKVRRATPGRPREETRTDAH